MMSINEMIEECLKRLRREPTAPVERIAGSVCYHYSEKVFRQVRREVSERWSRETKQQDRQ